MTSTTAPVLILGGIAEARQLAATLTDRGVAVIYSIAGLVRKPQLDCEVRVGGYSYDDIDGGTGLAEFIESKKIRLLIDATHPYAAQISKNAVNAAKQARIPCWRLLRDGFSSEQIGDHQRFGDMEDLIQQIAHLKRPLFTTGKSQLEYLPRRQAHQHWFIRSAVELTDGDGYTVVQNIGPFTYDIELELMQSKLIDGLICKDGGSAGVAEKFRAARQLSIPVYVLARPELVKADREFTRLEQLIAAVSPGAEI